MISKTTIEQALSDLGAGRYTPAARDLDYNSWAIVKGLEDQGEAVPADLMETIRQFHVALTALDELGFTQFSPRPRRNTLFHLLSEFGEAALTAMDEIDDVPDLLERLKASTAALATARDRLGLVS